jgi:single-strand DNA-binding protein
MPSLNFAIAMGRLTGDPELKHTSSDLAFTRFSIAVDRIGKSAEKQTDFFNVVAWGSNAEFICKYFKKGNLIIIEARMQTGSYEGKDGVKRQNFDLVVNKVHFAGPKSQDDSSSYASSDFSGNAFSNSDNSAFSDVADDDDDLPF